MTIKRNIGNKERISTLVKLLVGLFTASFSSKVLRKKNMARSIYFHTNDHFIKRMKEYNYRGYLEIYDGHQEL